MNHAKRVPTPGSDGQARGCRPHSSAGGGKSSCTHQIDPPRLRVLHSDRGSVSAELVIATPVLLLMLLTIVQFALWSHATHVAQAAASHGLAAARAQGGTAAAGGAAAQQMLDELASGPLTETSVHAERTTMSAAVRISGSATSIVPFLHMPVHAEAAGPTERFVPMWTVVGDPEP